MEKQTSWLDREQENIGTSEEYGRWLKLEENKIVEIEIDFANEFEKKVYDNELKKITKAIIPVKHDGKSEKWGVNVRNPMYRDIIEAGRIGHTHFQVMRTGQLDKTKYIIVKHW